MPSNISNDYIITNYSSSLGENTIAGGSGSAGTPAQAASGSILISVTGSSFDSADYPRFTLGDGTNNFTFVIDDDARGLKLDDFTTDAINWTSTSDQPFEDSQVTRLVVPTKDNNGGDKPALISFYPSDYSGWTGDMAAIITSNSGGTGLSDITTRPHFVFRDASGNEMKLGFGESGSYIAAGGGVLTTLGQFSATGTPRYWVYRENTGSSNYYIAVIPGSTNEWRANMPWIHAVNEARKAGILDIQAYGLKSDGTLMDQTLSSGGGLYTPQSPKGIVYRSTVSGSSGNTCYIQFNDPTGVFVTGDETRRFSWGYDEYTVSAIANSPSIRHTSVNYTGQTYSQYFGEHKGSKIYFRQGTVSGSTPGGAALSTSQIAEELKVMINASELNMTATRSTNTVNLTNSTTGTSGNVTITAVSSSALFTVDGMSGGAEAVPGSSGSVSQPADVMPYRLSVKGAFNLRGQTTTSRYKVFLGEENS